MKTKKFLIVSFLILAILTIGAVSASDNDTVISSDDSYDSLENALSDQEDVVGDSVSDDVVVEVSEDDAVEAAVEADSVVEVSEDDVVKVKQEDDDILADPVECDAYISSDAYGDVYYKDTKTVVAYLEDMPKNANGKLVLYEKGNAIASKSLVNGKATIKLGDLNINPSSKVHNIVAKYVGDDYKVDDCDIELKVIYYTLKGTEVYAGGTAKFTVTLPKDATGTVYMSGGKSAKISNGKAVISVPNMKLGVHSFSFKFSDSKYGFSDSIDYFVVYPKTFSTPSKVYAGVDNFFKIAFPKASSGKISVTVTSAKTGKDVTYTVSYKNGKASFPASKLKSGNYYLTNFKIKDSKYGTLKYTDTPSFMGEGLFSDFNVYYPKLTLKKVNVKKSAKKITLVAKLGKVNKKFLKNKKIVFKFNGKKYNAKTNAKGVAKVTIKKSVLKKLTAGKKISYSASFFKKTVKNSVKVKK